MPLGSRRLAAPPPGRVRAWLADPTSLTRRVVQACDHGFRVRLRRQGWARALPSEARLLEVPPGRTCMLREVELLCGDRPWVFARTLIPATSLHGGARRLTRLGERPLGAVLFADPHTRRERVEVARLTPRHRLFANASAGLGSRPGELWGRRTLFRFAGQPLLVNEIFLPEIAPR